VVDDEVPHEGEEERRPVPAPEEGGGFAELRAHVPAAIRDVSFPTAGRGYERRAVDSYVNQVNRLIAELEVGRSPQAAVRHALDRVAEQTKALLQQARETAEEITASARTEAEEDIVRARVEAEAMIASARAAGSEAEQIVASARAEAGGIIARARARRRRSVCSGSRKRSWPRENRPRHEYRSCTPKPRRSGRNVTSCSTRST
jgi:DivIVA domain-containing protein